ncbi:MAG: DUF4062 domain-containing protein [Vicinamibacterales bacterium]
MVSSTFYDLRQVREDLRRFIGDELGYRALLSEHPSFPVDPDLTTIENCRQRVQRDADVLVLIIGRRYGSVEDASATSVTNLEYLAARQKGIPIWAFVDQGILPLIPTWRLNPTADYSNQVDTPKLFEFVETVRTRDSVWTHEFRTAQDIVDALRVQFAYQHERGLRLQQQQRPLKGERWLKELRGDTLRIALEKPDGWEYRLFANAWVDAVGQHYRERSRHRAGVVVGLGEDVQDPLDWIQRRLSEATRFAGTANKLINETLPIAFGPAGEPGNAEAIVLVAETIGEMYLQALKWHGRLRTANIDDQFDRLRDLISSMLDEYIRQIEEFGLDLRDRIEAAVAQIKADGEPQVLNLVLTIRLPDGVLEELDVELDRLRASI